MCRQRLGFWQESLGIKRRSVEGWIKSGHEEQREGDRWSILNPIQIDQLVAWLEEDCQLALKQLQDKQWAITRKDNLFR